MAPTTAVWRLVAAEPPLLCEQELLLGGGAPLPYDMLCVCVGARPKSVSGSPHVLTLRDTHSVQVRGWPLQSCHWALLRVCSGATVPLPLPAAVV